MRREPSIRLPGCLGSGSRRSRSHSVILIPSSTFGKLILSRARGGPAGTGSKKIFGRREPRITGRFSKAERAAYSADLVKNTAILHDRVPKLDFSADEIANGSRGLLDEVATGKITGEEEYWSRTDLWDFQANIEGASVAFEGLRPLLRQRDPDLEGQIAAKFATVQSLLDAQREGDGFKTYDKLTQAEVKQLSDAVNALSEPLSKLAAA